MTAFNYLAKRGMVESSFSAVGSDISAALSDNSFNATSTDLSGALDDEYFTVSGFSDAANNGEFQVNGNSVTAKIIQDTGNLVVEAAGSSIVLQGYLRGIGESYDIETTSHRIITSDKPVVNRAQALDGTPETIYTRNDVLWDITTDFIEQADFLQWQEFLRSVHGGEAFTFDAYGTVASPDNVLNVELMGAPQYLNPYSTVMQISLRMRVL